jgi:hypothetical protein
MKINKIFIILLFITIVYGCKKDLGNYTYKTLPVADAVGIQDQTFPAIEGDSLIIRPYVVFTGGDPLKDLTYTWEIDIPEKTTSETYTGFPLAIVYNLAPATRNAKLTITVKATGVKYFYTFNISGVTQFSSGRAVLSVQNGVTKLSFVEPNKTKTVLSDLYYTLNELTLPANPVQLYAKPFPAYTGSSGIQQYWVMCNDPTKSSVLVDASTMLKVSDFSQQFLSPPAVITDGNLQVDPGGYSAAANGVINNKLYVGITTTAPFAVDFGKYGNAQPGNYTMSPFFTQTTNFYFGFDPTAGAFISFDAGGNYNGSDYQVNGNAFDPTATGMHNLLFMKAESGTSYAFMKGDDGTVYEYSFTLNMDDYSNRALLPIYKRVFAGAAFLQPDSKWQKSQVDEFYFSSNDKIYSYNPINQKITLLNANFGGAKITMLQLSGDGNTLTAGVDGIIYFLDVSVGASGSIMTDQTITGIPGTPVDMVSQ